MNPLKPADSPKILLYMPDTEEGLNTLKNCVSEVHADLVNHRLRTLDVPYRQKRQLLNALLGRDAGDV